MVPDLHVPCDVMGEEEVTTGLTSPGVWWMGLRGGGSGGFDVVVWRKYHGGTAVEEVIELAQRLSIPFRAFDGGSRLVSLYTQVSLMECDRSRPMVITLHWASNMMLAR